MTFVVPQKCGPRETQGRTLRTMQLRTPLETVAAVAASLEHGLSQAIALVLAAIGILHTARVSIRLSLTLTEILCAEALETLHLGRQWMAEIKQWTSLLRMRPSSNHQDDAARRKSGARAAKRLDDNRSLRYSSAGTPTDFEAVDHVAIYTKARRRRRNRRPPEV